MVSVGAYPPGTWEGDPLAPWNATDEVEHVCGTCLWWCDVCQHGHPEDCLGHVCAERSGAWALPTADGTETCERWRDEE